MLLLIGKRITNPTRMLMVGDIVPAAVVLTLRWDQRFESAFLQHDPELSDRILAAARIRLASG
jgi:hypothetical protein